MADLIPTKCPKCDSTKIVQIAYGLPSDETREAAKRDEVRLGGCVMGEDNAPNWECTECGNRWSQYLD